jgi:colanic acid/amylovoran biosynthesis glycosyltransferase
MEKLFMLKHETLVIITSLLAKIETDGQILITEKFLDGVKMYCNYWEGPVTVFIEQNNQIGNNLDQITVNPNQLPFNLQVINFDQIEKYLEKESVVLSSIGYRQNHISKICHSLKIPCLYVSEYTLKTRLQIIDVNTNNLLLKIRKKLWEKNQESEQTKAIAIADGIQCNGLPTYNAYRHINQHSLLYFDTRIITEQLATIEQIEKKYLEYESSRKLRLLFSGRLIKMKGADHLIKVAHFLCKLKVNFEMFICGDGLLKEAMQKQVLNDRLETFVKFLGVLDFKTELIPFLKENVDLFVCCHRQGDPSCTYLETMSCGVPIVGYDNEAFAGLVEYCQVGWTVPLNQPQLLAKKIFQLAEERRQIKEMSLKSLDFASQHTFEKTFAKRINHIQHIMSRKSDFSNI